MFACQARCRLSSRMTRAPHGWWSRGLPRVRPGCPPASQWAPPVLTSLEAVIVMGGRHEANSSPRALPPRRDCCGGSGHPAPPLHPDGRSLGGRLFIGRSLHTGFSGRQSCLPAPISSLYGRAPSGPTLGTTVVLQNNCLDPTPRAGLRPPLTSPGPGSSMVRSWGRRVPTPKEQDSGHPGSD